MKTSRSVETSTCDRCGLSQEYDPGSKQNYKGTWAWIRAGAWTGRKQEADGTWSNTFIIPPPPQNPGYSRPDTSDLCPKCFIELQAWWERKSPVKLVKS